MLTVDSVVSMRNTNIIKHGVDSMPFSFCLGHGSNNTVVISIHTLRNNGLNIYLTFMNVMLRLSNIIIRISRYNLDFHDTTSNIYKSTEHMVVGLSGIYIPSAIPRTDLFVLPFSGQNVGEYD